MTSPLSTSGKMLAIVAGLALVTATVVLWGAAYKSGSLVRENADLTCRLNLAAPEPQWTKDLTRELLEKSLRAACPEVMEKAAISFAAPRWAIVRQDDLYLLLKWESVPEGLKWTLLDRAEKAP